VIETWPDGGRPARVHHHESDIILAPTHVAEASMGTGSRSYEFMVGRPKSAVEFARRGLQGRRLSPDEIAIEAAKLGLPVSAGGRERRAPPTRRSLKDEASRLMAN
jgi:hypothetical protein